MRLRRNPLCGCHNGCFADKVACTQQPTCIENLAIENRAMKLLLLLVPCILSIFPVLYNLIEPRFLGFPFFYWFQLVLIPVSSLTIYVFHKSMGR